MPIPWKTTAIIFTPAPAGSLPANSLYVDSVTNDLSSKDSGGAPGGVGGGGGGGTDTIMTKVMQNLSGLTIPINSPVAKKPNGSIILADADAVASMKVIGVALTAIADNAQAGVSLIGANAAGVLTGLGYAPGDDVYLSKTGGYTNNVNTFNPLTDVIVRLGYADCAAGAASATATDLIMFAEVLSSP